MFLRLVPLAMLFMSGTAAAIVNVEGLRVDADGEGWSGKVSLASSGTSGNTETRDWGLGAYVQNKAGPRTDFVIGNYNYGESNGARTVDNAMVHGRRVQAISERRAWEAFLQWEQDDFRRLSDRELAGGGLRWRLGEGKPENRFHLGVGAFYEYENLEVAAGAPAETNETVRGNLYLSIGMVLTPNTRLASTTYFQPNLEDTGDRRASEQAALVVDVNESVAITLSLDVSYDSDPPSGVESTDTAYTTAIGYKF